MFYFFVILFLCLKMFLLRFLRISGKNSIMFLVSQSKYVQKKKSRTKIKCFFLVSFFHKLLKKQFTLEKLNRFHV